MKRQKEKGNRKIVPTLLLTLMFLAALAGTPVMAQSATPPACGPIDLAIVLDNTGSMGPAINNIKAELPAIISAANTSSGGDLRVGYVTFGQAEPQQVIVHEPLTTNISAVEASIIATIAGAGGDAAEPSDEAKNTVINNLAEGTRADIAGIAGTQAGNFTEAWRAGATKIAVLITDAPSNGFGEGIVGFGNATYYTYMNTTLPAQALSKGILFSDAFVPTSGDYAGQAAVLEADANGTGGVFMTVASDGTGTGAAITAIIERCGAAEPTGSISGMKFDDVNGNGINDGEPGLANWTITITNSTGALMSTVTDANGSYTFSGLTAGIYNVSEVAKPGWVETEPSGGIHTINLSAGQNSAGNNFGNMRIPPNATCVESVNPSGKRIPPAGSTTLPGARGGQNEDGFYRLLAIDLIDPNPQIFVNDTGSGTIFGPFANGTNIKYIQAHGATPASTTMGGPNSAVAWQIKGKGDAAIYAVNADGAVSPSVYCRVSPPPK